MLAHRTRSACWSLVATALVCAVTLLIARTLHAEPAPTTTGSSYRRVPVSLWLIPQLGTGGLSGEPMETNLALSLGVSGYGRLRGADVGVVGSWITDSMSGAQVTTALNYVGLDARGVQLTAGVNIVRGELSGVQVSSGYNHATALRGAQIGLVNFGSDVTGSQIGLINIGGRVRGTQIGLLNLAEDADAPVGLLSLSKEGQHHVELWGSDTAPLNVGAKLGGRYVYTLLTAGYQPQGGEETDRWMLGIGLGGHLPLSQRFYIDTDVVAWHVNNDESWTEELNMLAKLRVVGGYRIHDHFAVFAGATLNALVTRVDDGADFGLFSGRRVSADSDETTVRVWPGFVAGLRI